MIQEYQIALLSVGAVWIVCALLPRPVREALRNGLRCLGRYPELWRIPLLFGIFNAVFPLARQAAFMTRMGTSPGEWLTTFHRLEWPDLASVARYAGLQATESTATVFTLFTGTFPLSALCAVAFLVNANGVLGETCRAVVRRLPRSGWILVAVLLISALAAIVHPFLELLLPEAIVLLTYYGIVGTSMLAFVFEYVLGVFFLTYLMLMSFAWIRGLQFQRYRLTLLAARRTGFVLKWSLLLAALASILVVIPQLLALWLDEPASSFAEFLRLAGTQWGLIVVLAVSLVFCPAQAILVFHNESLRHAMRESLRFLRTNTAVVLAFLLAVFLPFLLVSAARGFLMLALGADSIGFSVARIILAAIDATFTGWFIAAWVCLYKSRISSRNEIQF